MHGSVKMARVETVIVLAAGPDLPSTPDLPAGATVIAADGGANHARRLGLHVDLLVGDLDSVSKQALAGARNVERHPTGKDATDLELALAAAVRLEPKRILVIGGSRGRLDHLFGSLLLLASDDYVAATVDAQFGEATVHVIRGERQLDGSVGELISLFAIRRPACGISTEGLLYSLAGETMHPGSSRGVSNVFANSRARINLDSGVLLAVRPNGTVMAGSSD